MPTGMAVALDMAVLWSFLRLLEAPTVGRALATGGLLGVAALAVPKISCRSCRSPWAGRCCAGSAATRGQAAFLGLALLVGTAAAIVPVACRNAVVSGEWVPISTNGGINLYIGNNAEATRTLGIRPGPDWEELTRLPQRAGRGSKADRSSPFYVKEVALCRGHSRPL